MQKVKKTDDPIRFLSKIQEAGFKTAVIAGGFVRDLYFEQMYRDIDLYVWDPKFSSEPTDDFQMGNFAQKHWAKYLNLTTTDPEYSITATNNHIRTVHGDDSYSSEPSTSKITSMFQILWNYVPFELIYTKEKPVDFVNKYYNIGLCKAYFDGSKIRFTEDFMHDARNKCMTVVGQNMSRYEWERTISEHIPRLLSKYPGFHIEIAQHNMKYVELKKYIKK